MTIDHLKQLIEMGFDPMAAVVIFAVCILWLALIAVCVFFFRLFLKDRKDRDALRQEQLEEIDERLTRSEKKHDECDEDRKELHKEMEKLQKEVERMKGCPRKDCPMRVGR